MKSEVAFFKDKRATTGLALLETLHALGMTDQEIKVEMLKIKRDEAWIKVEAAKSIGPDAVSAAYNLYRDAYAAWYEASEQK